MSIDYIVCDLDGTICDIRHRQHLAQCGDWEEFHGLIDKDAPRATALSVLNLLRNSMNNEGHPPELIFLTGRPEQYRPQTEKWLADNALMFLEDDYAALLMRGKHQGGSDTVVKQELLETYLKENYGEGVEPSYWMERVIILDDRDKVVAHFRDLGYEAWQVAEGAY